MAGEKELPHIDAVCGQAAWSLSQAIGMLLVRDGVLAKADLQEGVASAMKATRLPGSNPAQRASAILLAQFHDLLNTADRSDAH